ncbi:sn-glycerol-3-phosphate transport system permease protein ugpA [uncultured Clostridium sp.]|uniref:Sugar ABC transporter permease n=1 Tax=Muricoprocola aceti TaxID=2981772 RepID=A0ABT2SNC9_9FIRM|nr:sugar ABC transporter permease [Muricoprocola aceti]MCU6726024.1 sugar ABC transporter permease [Muricoprocola aceti]SCH74758.1 sn-glycerol-3-phosphate transport system permease protein ugpA [uncultured Clostridium sp.]
MKKILGNKVAIVLFTVPSLLLFGGIILYSIVMSFHYSLLDWTGFGEGTFIGLTNYVKMFQDKVFLRSAGNSLLLGGVTLLTQLPLALFLALLLTSNIKGENFYRTVFFIPMTLSSVVIGQLWLKVYNPNYGILNSLLGAIGVESLQRNWLGDVDTALLSAFVPIIWQNVGYHMLLFYTSINGISKDIMEAAKLDGATGFKTAIYITIPLVKPMIRTCAIFVVIGSLKAFDMIYVLTNGGPVHVTEVPSSLMFSSIFNLNKYGYGSSISIFIVVECIVMAMVLQKLIRVKDDSYE